MEKYKKPCSSRCGKITCELFYLATWYQRDETKIVKLKKKLLKLIIFNHRLTLRLLIVCRWFLIKSFQLCEAFGVVLEFYFMVISFFCSVEYFRSDLRKSFMYFVRSTWLNLRLYQLAKNFWMKNVRLWKFFMANFRIKNDNFHWRFK